MAHSEAGSSTASVRIEKLEVDVADKAGAAAWDQYVGSHPHATPYHVVAWQRLIHDVFGHQSCCLVARSEQVIVGVLPLVRLKSRIFGDYMVSMPYFNYGGALTDSPNITRQLMTEAGALAERLGCAHIEFRDTAPQQPWVVRTDKVVMELSLPESFESLWNMFGPKLRAQVRRPQKEGADIVWGNEELLSDFYSIFARNMRDLGTPVYPLRFFSAILHAFPKQTSIGIVRYMNRAVAGCFLVGFRERLEIPWASSLREFNSIGVNMLLYSESLKQAIEKGYRVFDFGRSSVGSGTYRFKKQWGARERQLYWHYWLRSGATLPNLTPNNRKYRLAIEVWKRLPLFVANRLGPVLVENLP